MTKEKITKVLKDVIKALSHNESVEGRDLSVNECIKLLEGCVILLETPEKVNEKELKEEQSCCPNCGSQYWGRNWMDKKKDHDFTIRHCNSCGHNYLDPDL